MGSIAFAAEYTSMVDIPRVNNSSFTTQEYVQAVYFLAITAAALMAIVKIIYGGVQYMLDGVVTHKEQAKKEIQGAIFGLLIVLTAVLLLNTINPQLTKLSIFRNAPGLDTAVLTSPPVDTVQIGEKHGMYCMGDNWIETITTFICSEESQAELAQWEESCEKDGGGTMSGDILTGYYTCVAK